MAKHRKVLISLSEDEISSLNKITVDLGLKYKNITVAFLINRFTKYGIVTMEDVEKIVEEIMVNTTHTGQQN